MLVLGTFYEVLNIKNWYSGVLNFQYHVLVTGALTHLGIW